MSDKTLRQDVIDELNFDPSIDSAHIGVTAEEGVVTLSGHVPTLLQKLAAERAAWRVKGVKAIAEHIEVRIPGDKRRSDDEIAGRALDILAWNAAVPSERLHVKVQDGTVTLSGDVDWNYQRDAAVAAVRRLSGVAGVINAITLAPGVQPENVKQRIVDALKRHAEVEASRIRISVKDGGRISLEGEVDSWDELRATEQAVWSVPGVHAVEDHLRIG